MLFHPVAEANAMHIPDGFLSIPVSILLWAISLVFIGIALRKTRRNLDGKQTPLLGVMAAAIFAGQMINFTIIGGTSGHLLGSALAVILLGPWSAVLVMTTVVSVQAIVFQDGGVLALGANIFNMAILGVFVAYAIHTLIKGLLSSTKRGSALAGFVSGWSSVFVVSLACAIQLAISGTSPANIAIPAMAFIHALIGIAEGMITVGAISFIAKTRNDLLQGDNWKNANEKSLIFGGLSIALLLIVLSPLASSHPDGLEWVADRYGFSASAQEALYHIIPDYVFPGIQSEPFAKVAAGIIGGAIVFFVSFGLSRKNKQISSD